MSGPSISSSEKTNPSFHLLLTSLTQHFSTDSQLFGEDNADEDVSPDTADPEAASQAGADALAAEADEKGNVARQSTRTWAQACDYDAEKLFNKLFHDDIEYLLSMANLWKTRTAPKPIKFGDYSEPGTSSVRVSESGTMRDQKVWTLTECAAVLSGSLQGLRGQFKALSEGDHLVWDKDDKHGMDFVAACANIRAIVFHIPQKSRFEVKSMAGNIIPAIATTNAITAGMVVLHSFKVLREQFEACPNVYMRLRPNARNQIITADKFLNPPNPKCYVCSAKPEVTLRVDTDRLTIKELRDEVLIKAMNMIDPDVLIDGTGTIVLSSEEGETEANNGKTLAAMSIVDGAVLKVDDFHQNYELTVIIVHQKAEYDQSLFEVIADPTQLAPIVTEETKKAQTVRDSTAAGDKENGVDHTVAGGSTAKVQDDEDDDSCVILDDEVEEVPAGGLSPSSSSLTPSPKAAKRKSEEKPVGPTPKKSKLPPIVESVAGSSSAMDDDIICIDDD